MSTAGPSTFAQLLKRSKFASFDPSIAQIYTSYGGYAHRGDYGLKRPLPPAARRGQTPLITVKAVDSPLMQTEWGVAENQGRWIKRFDETGAGAKAEPGSTWEERPGVMLNWEVDSSFDKSQVAKRNLTRTPPTLPNWNAMTQAEFDVFLDKMRKLRPQFKEFLKQRRLQEIEEAMSGIPDGDPLKSAKYPPEELTFGSNMLAKSSKDSEDLYWTFLTQQGLKEKKTTRRRGPIDPVPHPNAGLSYTHDNIVQSRNLYPTVPGRVVRTKSHKNVRQTAPENQIAVGGTMATIKVRAAGPIETKNSLRLADVAKSADPEAVKLGEVEAQIHTVTVISPPNIVGLHNGLGGAAIKMEAEQAPKSGRDQFSEDYNPHPLGSKEYVGFVPPSRLAARETAAFNAAAFSSKADRASHKEFRKTRASLSALRAKLAGKEGEDE